MQQNRASDPGQQKPDLCAPPPYEEIVSQRVNQILCGYEDSNDCDRLRKDSTLKMSAGRRPSDADLCSQTTMTRLENNVGSKTLYKIGLQFAEEYVRPFATPPRHVVLDVDDTNANTYGAQHLTLFNSYYEEYCYMPLLVFDGINKKLIFPLLRPGCRNKSAGIFRILRLLIVLHKHWSKTVFELRGDSHFCSHEFMDWAWDKYYVRHLMGLGGNARLLKMVGKQRRRAENDLEKAAAKSKDSKGWSVIRRYFKFDYRASRWQHEQRVVAKIEVSAEASVLSPPRTGTTRRNMSTGDTANGRNGTLDKGPETFQGRPYVVQFLPCQLLPAVPLCRGHRCRPCYEAY